MKHHNFKSSILSILSVCILLLLSSQSLYAKRPGTTQPTPTTVIHSVVLDTTSSTIVVSGADLDAITEVTLAGLTVNFTSADGLTGVISFADIDAAVTTVLTAGNYALGVGDTVFSIYLSAADATAITPPDPVIYADCPCLTEWQLYGANYQYIDPIDGLTYNYVGFEGGTGSIVLDTNSEVDVYITKLQEAWQLNVTYDSSTGTGTCKTHDIFTTYFTEDITTQAEFNACASYMKDTYVPSI